MFLAPMLYVAFQFFIHKLSLGAHFLVPNLSGNVSTQDVSLGSGCVKTLSLNQMEPSLVDFQSMI